MAMAETHLRKVRTAARGLEKARATLRETIWQAHMSGESGDTIARWAGLSRSRIYDLIREARELNEREPGEV